ncbi:hypothetical protein FoTM2_017453 [Fusarium oxysporum f. sp. vasinfectum]|nr:hypothetical protein FoTM2_017453 [Fusarium oxysporum f. sp. vasinfectum]
MPRQPKPSRSPESISLIKTFLRALPKGEEDWDDKAPRTQEQIEQLRLDLTLSKLVREGRAKMKPKALLQSFAEEHAALLRNLESQIHSFVFIALGDVAIKSDLPVREVDEMTMAYTGAQRSAVRTLRLGVRRWIKASDTLRQSWLPRADELPLRRRSFIHVMKKIPDEDIEILREMTVEGDQAVLADVKVYIPKKQLSSSSLRIPNIIYELHGGKLSLVDIESHLAVSTASNAKLGDDAHDSTDHNMMQVMEGFALPTREPFRKGTTVITLGITSPDPLTYALDDRDIYTILFDPAMYEGFVVVFSANGDHQNDMQAISKPLAYRGTLCCKINEAHTLQSASSSGLVCSMKISPDLLRNDSQRTDNAIARETSAEFRVPSDSNDRQSSHHTDAHGEPTDDTIRTSAQVSQPSNIEEMEQRIEACLRENRTSPYELAELCEGKAEQKEPERNVVLTRISVVQDYTTNGAEGG